jgi:hypothetical protein
VDCGALAAGQGPRERSFQTAQDRLVKGLRVAGAKTLEQANIYLETEFLTWWNQTLTVVPSNAADAHRGLDATHSLPASLSYVEARQVGNDYTIQFDNKTYQIARSDVRAGLRGAEVRVEVRLDASLAVCFRGSYLTISKCHPRPKASPALKAPKATAPKTKPSTPRPKSQWMKNFIFTSPEKAALLVIPQPASAPVAKPIR